MVVAADDVTVSVPNRAAPVLGDNHSSSVAHDTYDAADTVPNTIDHSIAYRIH